MWKLALIVLVLAAGVSAAISLRTGGSNNVSISGGAFSPKSLKIGVGDSVTWTNNDDRDHQIVADDGSFSSKTLKAGDTFQYAFKKAGTYGYSCQLHPRERGTVGVE